MTRTEERLTAALRETARSVREGSLSPLVVPAARRSRWARRLAPVAAAAAVALIAVLALVLPGRAHKPVGGPPPGALPRYYVVLEQGILVLSTRTGSIVDSVSSPGSKWTPVGVAAAGDRRFVAEYAALSVGMSIGGTGSHSPTRSAQTRLYSFRLTSRGQVTGFSLVPGGVLTGFVPDQAGGFGSALAVSPDGSRIALVVDSALSCPAGPNGCPDEIAVIDVRTGQHELWKGGLNRSGIAPAITGISWAADSGPLVFLAQWCPPIERGLAGGVRCTFIPLSYQIAQVRTLNLATQGGSLTHGSVLLGQSARHSEIVAARLVPGRAALAIIVLSPLGRRGLDVRVIDVPLGGGGQSSVLYHTSLSEWMPSAGLSPDESGRHWLLSISDSSGWISYPGGGGLHRFPPPSGYRTLVVPAGYGAW